MSDVSCDGCMEAITCNRANLAKSEAATTCACSMRSATVTRTIRLRRSFKSVQRNTVGPVSNRVEIQLKASFVALDRQLRNLSGSIVMMPLVFSSSE
jgi:hypothetical protein